MNTVNLFDSFVYRTQPNNISIDCMDVDGKSIDCCLISKYNSPSDLWVKLLHAIYNANIGCKIFIDSLSCIRPGAILPYSATVSLMACVMAVDVDINTINTEPNSTIILEVHRKGIHISPDALNTLDFSLLNSRIMSNTCCGMLNLMRYTDIMWLRSSVDTCQYTGNGDVDVVFTLAGAHSPSDNEELRIALRSIDKYADDVGNIWIVTDNPPDWLTNAHIIEVSDSFSNNKDANLINKVLAACANPQVSERFIYWSDDQVLTSNLSLKDIIPVYNNRGIDCFANPMSKWSARMHHTLEVVKMHGGDVSCNWDSHIPQPVDKSRFGAIMRKLDYKTLPGLCINTAYFGVKGETKRCQQEDVKITYEDSTCDSYVFSKIFVGYNDAGYNAGLREALLDKFNKPSKYEKN